VLRGRWSNLKAKKMALVVTALLLAAGGLIHAQLRRATALHSSFSRTIEDLRVARRTAITEQHTVVAVFVSGPPAALTIFSDIDDDRSRDPGEPWLVKRTWSPEVCLDASRLTPGDSLAFASSGDLARGCRGGVVTFSLVDSDESRSFRAWNTGAIERLD
jgi:hypothetical protein